jgi:hypothetical protein
VDEADLVELAKEAQTALMLYVWHCLASKYGCSEDSVLNLAARLEIRQMAGSPEACPAEDFPYYRNIARELGDRQRRAWVEADWDFFRRLSRAGKLMGSKAVHRLSATGAAVYAFRELWGKSDRWPTKQEVRALVGQRCIESNRPLLTDRQWRRIFANLAPLFP